MTLSEPGAYVTGMRVARGLILRDLWPEAPVGERLIGLDLSDIGPAGRARVPGMAYTPWDNVTAYRRAFAGIELAMWDARARTEGQPLFRLLGGAVRRDIPLTEYFSYLLPGAEEPGETSPASAPG